MDALDPSQSLHGANLLPHLPPISAEPQGIDPFPEALEQEYTDYLHNISTNRSLLTSRRPWEMREILNHPTTPVYTLFNINDSYSTELGRLRNLRIWTHRYFELDNNQIYHSAEGSSLKVRRECVKSADSNKRISVDGNSERDWV